MKGLTGISFLLCTNGLGKQASHVAGPLFSQSGQAVVGWERRMLKLVNDGVWLESHMC